MKLQMRTPSSCLSQHSFARRTASINHGLVHKAYSSPLGCWCSYLYTSVLTNSSHSWEEDVSLIQVIFIDLMTSNVVFAYKFKFIKHHTCKHTSSSSSSWVGVRIIFFLVVGPNKHITVFPFSLKWTACAACFFFDIIIHIFVSLSSLCLHRFNSRWTGKPSKRI